MASSPGASFQKASISATQSSPVRRLGLFAGSKQTVHFLFPFSTEGSHNSKYHQGPEWFKSKHSPDHRPLVRGRTLEGKPARSSLETREYTGAWGLLFLNAGGSPAIIDTCPCFLLSQPQGIDPSARPGEYRLVTDCHALSDAACHSQLSSRTLAEMTPCGMSAILQCP